MAAVTGMWRRGQGHHRAHHRPPAPARPDPARVLVEPAGGDLSVDELRAFLAQVDAAAQEAGVNPGGLRPWVAVRFSGAIKAIAVTVPAKTKQEKEEEQFAAAVGLYQCPCCGGPSDTPGWCRPCLAAGPWHEHDEEPR